MRHVELVIFENDSIMHEKALPLPIGKVSFRQLGMILAGMLAAMVAYFVTKDFIAPGVILTMFLGLGLVNTKIMTPDQMIKANLMFLIRGTSLSRDKPENLKMKKTAVNKKQTKRQASKKIVIAKPQKKFFSKPITDLITSLFAKINQGKSMRQNEKSNPIKIEVTNNRLKITPLEKIYDVDLLQNQISILSDGKEISRDFVTVNDKDIMIVPLDKCSNCNVSIIVDEGIEEQLC